VWAAISCHGDPNLAGHTVLIVEPEVGQIRVFNLQSTLERAGAETLIVRQPVDAFEVMRSFRFSAGVINYDHASGALHELIADLGDVPTLLYGGAGACIASARAVPQLPFTRATVDSIREALARLLSPGGDTLQRSIFLYSH